MDDLPQISVKEVSRRIKAAGVKDEWQVYCHLAGGDHAAAFMLRRCVVWSGGKRVQDAGGWFYKSDQDWKAESCLNRRKLDSSTILLKGVGLQTDVRQVSVRQKYAIGKVVTHYRIDPKPFWKALDSVLEKITGGCINCDDEMDDSSNADCTDCTSGDAQNGHQAMDESYAGECPEWASDGDQNGQMNLNLEGSSESSLQNETSEINLSPEREMLRAFSFSDFEISENALIAEVQRLGTDRSRQVIQRCAKLGKTWAYVLKALTNEGGSTSPSPSSADPLPSYSYIPHVDMPDDFLPDEPLYRRFAQWQESNPEMAVMA